MWTIEERGVDGGKRGRGDLHLQKCLGMCSPPTPTPRPARERGRKMNTGRLGARQYILREWTHLPFQLHFWGRGNMHKVPGSKYKTHHKKVTPCIPRSSGGADTVADGRGRRTPRRGTRPSHRSNYPTRPLAYAAASARSAPPSVVGGEQRAQKYR